MIHCDLANDDFFRIEGHIGYSLRDGYLAVDKLRQDMNLPFELTAVRMSAPVPNPYPPDPDLPFILEQLVFSTFAQSHPGLEHMAGVPKGGTFVIVYEEQIEDPELVNFLRATLDDLKAAQPQNLSQIRKITIQK